MEIAVRLQYWNPRTIQLLGHVTWSTREDLDGALNQTCGEWDHN